MMLSWDPGTVQRIREYSKYELRMGAIEQWRLDSTGARVLFRVSASLKALLHQTIDTVQLLMLCIPKCVHASHGKLGKLASARCHV